MWRKIQHQKSNSKELGRVFTKPTVLRDVNVCCCVCFVLQITFGKQQDNKFQRRNPFSRSLYLQILYLLVRASGVCITPEL